MRCLRREFELVVLHLQVFDPLRRLSRLPIANTRHRRIGTLRQRRRLLKAFLVTLQIAALLGRLQFLERIKVNHGRLIVNLAVKRRTTLVGLATAQHEVEAGSM